MTGLVHATDFYIIGTFITSTLQSLHRRSKYDLIAGTPFYIKMDKLTSKRFPTGTKELMMISGVEIN